MQAIIVHDMKLGQLVALSGSQILPSLRMLPTGMFPRAQLGIS